MKDDVLIYTDGSCDGNVKDKGIGGYASILYLHGVPLFISGYAENTTNQRMEMMAVITALEYLRAPMNVSVCTDSAYIYNCIHQEWYVTWKSNGWKNSKGEPVSNKDLWERMLNIIDFHNSVNFIKVKAHKDNIFNNKCDELAKGIVDFQQEVLRKTKQS